MSNFNIQDSKHNYTSAVYSFNAPPPKKKIHQLENPSDKDPAFHQFKKEGKKE